MTWFDAEAQAHRDILEEFGEMFTVKPMTQKPNYGSVADPSRPVAAFSAAFSWEAQSVKVAGDDTNVSSRNPTASYMRCDLPYNLRRTDVLVRHFDGSMFEITDVKPDGMSGAKAELVQSGVQS
jgi:hypothetical protein